MVTKRVKKILDEIKIDDNYIYIGSEVIKYNGSPITAISLHKPELSKFMVEYCNTFHGSIDNYHEYLLRNKKHNILATHFIQIPNHYSMDIYTNDDKRVKYLTTTSVKNFHEPMYNYLKFYIKDNDDILNDCKVFKDYTIDCINKNIIPVVKEYTKIANKPNEYGLAYFNLDLVEGDTPAWDSFMYQIEPEYREVFKSWLYSIFLKGNKCRQVCWLHGVGKSGKTTIANVIANQLTRQNKELVSTLENRLSVDKFTMASFENAILIIISDTRERRLLASDMVKAITGGDTVTIRGFNKEKRSAQIYCKIMVTSNYPPSVDVNQKHETSRVLLIPIDPYLSLEANNKWIENYKNLNWETELDNEFFKFLAKCKYSHYQLLDDDRNNIKAPEGMINKLSNSNFGKIALDIDTFCKSNTNNNGNLMVEEFHDAFCQYMELKKLNWSYRVNIYTYLIRNGYIVENTGVGSLQKIIGMSLNQTILTRKDIYNALQT